MPGVMQAVLLFQVLPFGTVLGKAAVMAPAAADALAVQGAASAITLPAFCKTP